MVSDLDKFLFKSVKDIDNIITWSEKAKKDRKARLEKLKTKSKLFSGNNMDENSKE